jgi:SPOR domain
METWAGMYNLTYFIVALAITAFCGGVIAHFLQSWTRNRWILFLAGVSATSILSSAAPGVLKILHLADLSPVSVAYAQQQSVDQVCTSPSFSLGEGLKQFFRISEPTGYRVVVGSFKNRNDALALANKINLNDASLHPSIADKYPGNDFYAVVVGPSSTTFDEAQKIQEKVLSLDYVPGAFISRWGC